jgi:hypothetical protein
MWVTAAVAMPLAVIAVFLGGPYPEAMRAAAYGGSLAGLNAIAAYGIVLWSEARSTNVFLGAVLGGMVGRMGLLLAAVAAGLAFLDLDRLPLVTTLLGYFLVFLVLEMKALHNRRPAPAPEAS